MNSFSALDIFPTHSTGVQTSRNRLVIGFTEQEVRDRLSDFTNRKYPDEFFRKTFFREHRTGQHLRGDTRGWKLSEVRNWAEENVVVLRRAIEPIAYRPFDIRYVINHAKMIDWLRHDVMQHLSDGPKCYTSGTETTCDRRISTLVLRRSAK